MTELSRYQLTQLQTLEAEAQGYPVIVDYYQRNLRINGPASAVVRSFRTRSPAHKPYDLWTQAPVS